MKRWGLGQQSDCQLYITSLLVFLIRVVDNEQHLIKLLRYLYSNKKLFNEQEIQMYSCNINQVFNIYISIYYDIIIYYAI